MSNNKSSTQWDCSLEYFLEKVLCGDEVELTVYEVPFFIGSYGSGTKRCIEHTVQNLQTGKIHIYSSRKQLVEKFRYQGKSLVELWPNISIG